MRSSTRRLRLPVLLAGLAAVAPLALSGSAAAAPTGPASNTSAASPAIQGTIKGFSTGDFAFLDALSVPKLNLAQASVAQSAAGVSNGSMQTTDTLGQDLLTAKSATGHNAYADGAGVSLNLGQADETVPQAQLAKAEALSPPRNSVTTKLLALPLSPVASVDVQPDRAAVNTTSNPNFCVLGAPLSEGTATVTNAAVLPVSRSIDVAAASGTVGDDSTEELDPNGAGALGLNSVSTLNTAGITLFKGVPAAQVTIKVISPLVLQAFAGGVSGSAKVTYGGNDAKMDVLSITAGGKTMKLTADQVLGGDALVIPVGTKTLHLLNISIGGKPSITMASNGTMASAVADLVSIQIVNEKGPTSTTIGGPLAPIVQPVLGPVLKALDGFVGQVQQLVEAVGLKDGVDLRIGHFEVNAQVPTGGIKCGLPVTKTTSTDPVGAGEKFTVTIRADNPYDCVVRNVRVDDKISATSGVTWTVGATRPNADKVSNAEVVWDNIGSIQPGGHRDLDVDITITPDSTPGKMSDTANVTGACGTGNGPGSSTVSLAGTFTLHVPQVNPATLPSGGRTLPDTGMSPMMPIGGGLLLAAGLGIAVIRRRVT
jgi:LPXTG-motif cell wall-anchored protein